MALPVIRHKDTTQIGVTVEENAEHVEDLSLQPVRSSPERRHGGHAGIVCRQGHTQANAMAKTDGIQLVHPQ